VSKRPDRPILASVAPHPVHENKKIKEVFRLFFVLWVFVWFGFCFWQKSHKTTLQ
jgi:hypothetical protein